MWLLVAVYLGRKQKDGVLVGVGVVIVSLVRGADRRCVARCNL